MHDGVYTSNIAFARFYLDASYYYIIANINNKIIETWKSNQNLLGTRIECQ